MVSPVTAAKWLRPHLILVTATDGLNSDFPNSEEGIISGVDDSDSFGPFPRMPKPHTNTSPLSEKKKMKRHRSAKDVTEKLLPVPRKRG